MIRERLGSEDPRPVSLLRSVLRRPWCWPLDEGLAARAVRLGARPDPPKVGHTAAVSVGPRVLWEVATDVARTVPLIGAAAHTAWLAPRVTAGALPLVRRVHALRRTVSLGLAPLQAEHACPAALDGASLGLALCLAHASQILDTPLPSHLMGCAAVDDRGRLQSVEALPEKLEWIWQNALGVTTILVARAQGATVAPAGIRVVPVSTLKEAIRLAFVDVDKHFAAGIAADAGLATEVSRELRRMVTGGRLQLASWACVADTADLLLQHASDQEVRRDARMARDIARRHEGHVAILPKPDLSAGGSLERSPRLRWLAQWVQSCADGDDDEQALAAAREALAHVAAPGERTEGDARLLGAIGRAHAAAGDELGALGPLRDAVRLWWALEHEADSTHALSELARVAGVLADAEQVTACAEWRADVAPRPEADPVSVTFVTAALVRAWTQLGRPDQAQRLVGELDRESLVLSPIHLRDSMIRWRARVLDALGQTGEADTLREELSDGTYRSLSDLDRARRDEGDVGAALAALRVDPRKGHEVVRLLRRTPREHDPAAWVAERFRY